MQTSNSFQEPSELSGDEDFPSVADALKTTDSKPNKLPKMDPDVIIVDKAEKSQRSISEPGSSKSLDQSTCSKYLSTPAHYQ